MAALSKKFGVDEYPNPSNPSITGYDGRSILLLAQITELLVDMFVCRIVIISEPTDP
mgnify:FL=1